MTCIKPSKTEYGVMSVDTVSKKFEGYTKKQLEKAKLIRDLQVMLDRILECEYSYTVRNKLLTNYPITITDTSNTKKQFGTDLVDVKVITVRGKQVGCKQNNM